MPRGLYTANPVQASRAGKPALEATTFEFGDHDQQVTMFQLPQCERDD